MNKLKHMIVWLEVYYNICTQRFNDKLQELINRVNRLRK